MTSLRYPDSGTRQVLYNNGDWAVNAVATVYADEAGTILAEIYADNAGAPGARDTTAQLILDAYGRQPDWWGPADGTASLWITVNGGPIVPVYADYGRRLDAVNGRVDTLAGQVWETPTGAQTKATAAQTAATGAAAALAIVFGG